MTTKKQLLEERLTDQKLIEEFIQEVKNQGLVDSNYGGFGDMFVEIPHRGQTPTFRGESVTLEILDHYLGEEDGSRTMFVAFKVPEISSRNWAFYGDYDSWDTSDWYENNIYEVYPKEVTRIEWTRA